MSPNRAFAACGINITQNAALDFTGGGTGTLSIPASTTTTTVDTSNVLSGAGLIYGSAPVRGSFSIDDHGSCGAGTITITLTDTGGASGVTLSWPNGSNLLKYNGTAFNNGAAVAHPNNTTLLVGARATYTSAVTAGTKSPTFNIAVVDNGVTQNFAGTASIKFDTALAVTPVSAISLGSVKALTAASYSIDTSGATSTVGGTFFAATPTSVGQLTIAGSSTQGLTISVTYTPDHNVTLSNAVGKYGGGPANTPFPMNVAAPGAGTTLLLGVTATPDGSQVDGTTATPAINVTVVYQ